MKCRLQQIKRWMVGMLLVLAGNMGCDQFDVNEEELTFPSSEYAGQFANFYVGDHISEQFEWSSGPGMFCVNVPTSGDYLLMYMTTTIDKERQNLITTPEMQSGAFAIAFRATAPARLYVGLGTDELLDYFTLHKGEVKPEAVGLYDDGPIIRYASPSIPTIFWNDVLTLSPSLPPMTVIKSDLACPPPLSPTPIRR